MILQKFRQQLGVKLFVLLTVLISLALVPLTYVVFSAIAYFGNYTAEVNREQIKRQAHSYLSTITREQAHQFDTFFSHVAAASSVMAAQATEIYNNINHYAGFPGGWPDATKLIEGGGIYSQQYKNMVISYQGDGPVSSSIGMELQALSRLEPVLKGVRKEIPESIATHLETITGIGCYSTDREGAALSIARRNRAFESSDLNIDPFTFYDGADSGLDETVWVKGARLDYGGSLIISARSPVVDSAGKLRGVTSIDIPLTSIVNDMNKVEHDSADDHLSETLFSFIIDKNGYAVVFPEKYLSLFGIDLNNEKASISSGLFSINLSHSTVSEIGAVLPSLFGEADAIEEVRLSGEMYILSSHSLHSLNWHLVMVTKGTKLTTSVSQTEKALSGTIQNLKRKFIANAVLIVVSILTVVFITVSYFIVPLKRLSEAATKVGNGNLKTRCYLDRSDELGTLADAFNDMVMQLQQVENEKENHARELEQIVTERTRDLRHKNFLLRDVISELNVESERRREAVEALVKSEEQTRVAMDASLAGHVIIQNGTLMYANPSVSRIFGYSLEEMVSGTIVITELVVAGQREKALQDLEKWYVGKTNKPYVLSCIRKDGSVFDALVGGAQTTWKGEPALVATVMDISEQTQVEEQLKESQRQLQESLAEKEVLLREIYHRTKNNMLVIISMLNLQSMDIDDEKVKTLFQETENRIRAMSLVHEKLYQSQSLVDVDLGQYLEEMVTALVETMTYGDRIRVQLDCERVQVSIDNIVPLGLAINEIVTNSLKHGFPGDRTGSIFIRLAAGEDGMVEVVVGDDGIGLSEDFNVHRARSFGMQITVNLIEKQLAGTMKIERRAGTVYRILFREPLRPKRI